MLQIFPHVVTVSLNAVKGFVCPVAPIAIGLSNNGIDDSVNIKELQFGHKSLMLNEQSDSFT